MCLILYVAKFIYNLYNQVDTDAHNRNREILETMLPRESPSRRFDAALLTSISFPAFALSSNSGTDGHVGDRLYHETKKSVLRNLGKVIVLKVVKLCTHQLAGRVVS